MDFEGQRKGEEVICVFRRHILTSVKGLLFFVVLTGLGIIPVLIWPNDNVMFFVWLAMIGVGILGWLYSWMLWHFSFYLLTSERLRLVRQKSLFSKTVVDLDLDKVTSISCSVRGLFGVIFNYGTILVQTEAGDLTLSMVSRPESVHNDLQNATHVMEETK